MLIVYEEFLHELRGKKGIEVYREMSEKDDVVGAIEKGSALVTLSPDSGIIFTIKPESSCI